jgi:hypothetical protein
MESNLPYVVLGVLYAYLLFLSWTPETVRLIFASKYLLPEVHIHSFSSMKLSFLSRKSSIIKLITIHICILHHAAYQHRKNVLQWVDFSFCMDSPFGCRSFCCKVLQFFYLFIPFRQIFLVISSLSFINDILTQIWQQKPITILMVNAIQICGQLVQWMVNEYSKMSQLIDHPLNITNPEF